MRPTLRLAACLLLAAATACSDQPAPPSAPEEIAPAPSAAPSARPEQARLERLARVIARALRDPALRGAIRSELDRSPFAEHKVQLQRLLAGADGRLRREVARLGGTSESELAADADAAHSLELYFPVPAHRAAWAGGEQLLVATAEHDGEAPVAFDVQGRRSVLDAAAPPVTPVLALVPAETNFDRAPGPQGAKCTDCGGGDGGGDGGIIPKPAPVPGLYMSYAHFTDSFEGWLKGDPEYEAHILGQSGGSDSLTSYQCVGEHAGGPYTWDQNARDWSGSVLVFSQTQLDAYRAQHPSQNFRVVFFEDDDTACGIRVDGDRFKAVQQSLTAFYGELTGTKDTTFGGVTRTIKRANALQKILRAIYSWITSQDDLIGNAIEDVVAGQYYSGANWVIKGANNATNGWVKLELR
jgi:hypothetical protein